jgi:predicted Zn-dependent protease
MISGLLVLLFCQPVPFTNRKQLQLIPQSQILNLSAMSFQQVTQQYGVVTGTDASQMVTSVGKKIQQAVEDYLAQVNETDRIKGFQWTYTLLDSGAVNAFAMPGGEVGVFKGMIPVADGEAGLAVVIGHEIAHAVAGHGNERMSQLLLVQLGGIALQEALSNHPKQTQELALVAFGVGSQLGILLPYSRLHEKEADQLGMIFMALAGYNPHQAVAFWGRMEQQGDGGGTPPEFLSTHPSYDTRIQNILEFIPEAMKYYRPET